MPEHAANVLTTAQQFTPEQVDCTTSVVLKILDGKCKMMFDAQQSIMAIYDVVKYQKGDKLGDSVHRAISDMLCHPSAQVIAKIHQLRIHAEAVIPKSTMKSYKAILAEML